MKKKVSPKGGGGIAIAACVVGVAAGVVKVASFIYDWVKED